MIDKLSIIIKIEEKRTNVYHNDNNNKMHYVFDIDKTKIDILKHPDTNIKKYIDVVLSDVNNTNLQHTFHQRTNNNKYISPQLQYATLFICLKKRMNIDGVSGNCLIAVDHTNIKISKSMIKIKILIAPPFFKTNEIILIGNKDNNRVHLVHIDVIKKYETCNILLCKKDSNMQFDEKLILDADFETFAEILNVLNNKIIITDVSNQILSEMDKLGLIKPEFMLMKRFIDKKTADILVQCSSFANGSELLMFATSSEMYADFKNIFVSYKNIVPIQMICVNHRQPNIDYMIGINIYDSIPIYYLETAWSDKPNDKMIEEKINGEIFDVSTWIDAKKCNNPKDINEIITKMLLSDYYGTCSQYSSLDIGARERYVTDEIYSDKTDAFITQYILNYVNCLKMENNINVGRGYIRKLKNFYNIRITDYDICHVSKTIRKLLIDNIEFQYHYCSSVTDYYYDFPLPRIYSKNTPLVKHFGHLADDDGWTSDIKLKIFYGFINIDFKSNA